MARPRGDGLNRDSERAESPDAKNLVSAAQPNLERTRGAIWGRILVTRLLGAAAPRYEGMAMLPSWWKRLSAREKLGSLLGTAKRTFRKHLRNRRPVREWTDPWHP